MKPKNLNSLRKEFEQEFFLRFIELNHMFLSGPIIGDRKTLWKSSNGNIIFEMDERSSKTNFFIVMKEVINPKKSSGLFGFWNSNTNQVKFTLDNDFNSEFRISESEQTLYKNLLNHSKKYQEEIEKLKSEFLENERKQRVQKGKNLKTIEEDKKIKRQLKSKKLQKDKEKLLEKFDSNNDGVLDVLESKDFIILLKKHQDKIKSINRDYVQVFVKISNYLKIKGKNLQSVFDEVSKVRSQEKLKHLRGLLMNQIHTYEKVYLHSLNMLISLVDGDDITFYEIYEVFDNLDVFNTKWEKDVSNQLLNMNKSIETLNGNIVSGFTGLLFQIDELERNLLRGMDDMMYLQGDYLKELGNSLSKELDTINSSINVNNLLTGIGTYQLYKINKNTKSLLT